ncbi:MAG: peptide deformylase [Egibacteraceae bacterium]
MEPLLRIRIFGDPILRERAAEVVDFDAALRRLAEDMRATMLAAAGVGLAANQVGVLKRLFTWATATSKGALVNPEVVDSSEELEEGDEGCLSFPGLYYPTRRPLRAQLRGYDVHGDPISVEGEGLDARVLLHELDHLNGILFIDHLARHDRKDAMRRIRAGELDNPRPQREAPVA